MKLALIATSLVGIATAAWVQPRHPMIIASGWNVRGVSTSVTRPRSLVFDSAGKLLVLQQSVGILAITLNGDGSVKDTHVVREDGQLNHGLAFSPDGKTLFASSPDAVWSWDYDAGSSALSNQKTLVTGMSQPGHNTRTVLVSTHNPDILYVSRGSSGNIDEAAADPASGRSTIKAYDLNSVPDGGYDQASQGEMIAYGVRNEVGMVEDGAGILWGVENSADDATRTHEGQQPVDIHNSNPGEALHSFGDVTKVSLVAIENKYYGYPQCYRVWDASPFPEGDDLDPGDFFVQEVTANTTDASCDSAVKARMLLPAHTAPLDIKFNDNDAYITLHGSWNARPPVGYALIHVPGQADGKGWAPQANATTTSGFTNLLAPPDLTACPKGCFRPTALVWNDKGDRLYVASDASDEIVLLQRGEASDSPNAAGRRAKLHVPRWVRRFLL